MVATGYINTYPAEGPIWLCSGDLYHLDTYPPVPLAFGMR